MGEHDVHVPRSQRDVQDYTKAALRDVHALEMMVANGTVESDVRRVGVEQEMYLVDAQGRPAPCAPELLAHLADQRFTTELARFSLEANLPPLALGGNVFTQIEQQLTDVMHTVEIAAAPLGARPLLTGILPTLRPSDLGRDSLSPEPRYDMLNEALLRAHGPITVAIDGIEQFQGQFDSVALEGVNTSLQLHLQVDPLASGRLYNLAQLISAPLLAAASNSPVLFDRRLWHETRVAVFERSLDSRTDAQRSRDSLSRVTFGDGWVKDTVVEIFHDNLARFPVLLSRATEEDSLALVANGHVPTLAALALHNGTVWRWNRPCYGVTGGHPHLRIECRILPAGPSILDEVANAALFYGLMFGLADDSAGISRRLTFMDARVNFLEAARHGLDARLTWLDEQQVSARELLRDQLLPRARQGLASANIADVDIDRYLGTVEARIDSGRSGSRWLLDVHRAAQPRSSAGVWRAAVAIMLDHQFGNVPVHQWPTAIPSEALLNEPTVGHIMTSSVFTLRPTDVIDLATHVMEWKHIRHIPVESEDGILCGLLTARELLATRDRLRRDSDADPVAIADVMTTDVITVPPGLSLTAAMRRMATDGIGCLLVTEGDRLVGIVTERDLVLAASRLLSDQQDTDHPPDVKGRYSSS